MRLLLMRHADAGHPDRDRWPDDRDRPLTDRGRREHRRVVASLHGGGVILDRLLSSPLRRAVETADIVAAVYSRPDSAEIVEALGEGATVAGLVAHLARLPADQVVLCVGHEPTLSSLARLLVRRTGDVPPGLERSGVLAIECEGSPSPRGGALVFHVGPDRPLAG